MATATPSLYRRRTIGSAPSAAHYRQRIIVTAVRPVTSIAVAILLAFIVGAFVFKLLSGGLSP